MKAADLIKQQVINADPKAIQQIHFTGYLGQHGNTTTFFIMKEAKENILDFLQRTMRVL